MEHKLYNQEGKEVGKIKLPPVFSVKWNDDMVHQVVSSMQSNVRVPVASVKSRAEVSGSGRKPWRQKGTGRARHGSVRSPIWVGGGVTHGPNKEKNFKRKINKKTMKKALGAVISKKLNDNEIIFLDKIELKSPKTREAVSVLNNLSKIKEFSNITKRKKNSALIALEKKDSKTNLGFRNISGVETLEARNLNVLDLLKYKYLVLAGAEGIIKSFK